VENVGLTYIKLDQLLLKCLIVISFIHIPKCLPGGKALTGLWRSVGKIINTHCGGGGQKT